MNNFEWMFWIIDGWEGKYSKVHLIKKDNIGYRTKCGIDVFPEYGGTPTKVNLDKYDEDEICKRCNRE